MTYEHWMDSIIKKAWEEGKFETENQFDGKAIDNSDYFNAPKEDRLCFHILKNQGFAPRAVELNKAIKDLKERINNCQDLKKKKALEDELSEKQNAYQMHLEHHNRKNPSAMGFRG